MSLWDVIRIPFADLRTTYFQLRKHLFQAPRPSGPYYVVDAPLGEVEAALGRAYFAPNWEFSYYKRGEVLNLARVEYDREVVGDRLFVWWQTHVRGWQAPDGAVELQAHRELEPTENGNEHIDGVGYSLERGMEALGTVLTDAGLDYREIDRPTEMVVPTG
ncbi:hypothetical protein ACOZ4N_10615 [Halorientalis pallida]|uniref:hypothetical protein n=1 Tax=Halorientalis pallida TaxID=2479928 RepID=UPI003C6F416E